MAEVYHLNFHTFRHVPVFADEYLAASIDAVFSSIIQAHRIPVLARAVMPNHVHVVVLAFPDQTRAQIAQLLKGASAREFNARYPTIAVETGGHLWQEGYDWVLVSSHRQICNTLQYVEANRGKVGLAPLSTDPDHSPRRSLDGL